MLFFRLKIKVSARKVPDSESYVTKQNKCNYEQIENRIADLVNERLSQFLSETLKPLEQSFLSALEIQDKGHNKLSDTVTSIHINQQTILNKLNSISCKEKQDQEKSDVENSTKYQEIVKIKDDLYTQTQVLQESLQKARHEYSLKEAELEHKLRTGKNKTIQIQQTNNEHL